MYTQGKDMRRGLLMFILSKHRINYCGLDLSEGLSKAN